jgi:hypothetical protein
MHEILKSQSGGTPMLVTVTMILVAYDVRRTDPTTTIRQYLTPATQSMCMLFKIKGCHGN